MGIRNRTGACATLRLPLMRSGRALRQFPFVAEQDPEEVVAPFRWRVSPGDFQAAGDRITAFAGAEAALPTETLLLDPGCFWLRPDMGRRAGPVGFAEGVTASDERNRLFVVHGHASENLADILGRRDRIRVAVRAFRIDVIRPICTAASGFSRFRSRSSVCHPATCSQNPSRRLLPAPRHPHDRQRSRKS